MPESFDYYRPQTRGEALELFARQDRHFIPLIIKPKPIAPRTLEADAFVDLSLLGMDTIRKDPDGSIHLGGLASLQAVIESPLLSDGTYQILGEAAAAVTTPGIRNLACLWGALLPPYGSPELLLTLLVLDTQITILGNGGKERIIPLQDFLFLGPTAIRKDEMVLEVVCPPGIGGGWALIRVARTPRDEAITCAAASVQMDKGEAVQVRLAVAGVNPQPVRLIDIEKNLAGSVIDGEALQAAAKTASAQADPPSDFRGSADYRREMAGVVVRRALEQAWNRGY